MKKNWLLLICIFLILAISVAILVKLYSGVDHGEPNASDPHSASDSSTTTTDDSKNESSSTAGKNELGYYAPSVYSTISLDAFLTQAPTLPIPEDNAPKNDWLAFFYGLLKPIGSPYNLALSSTYETARNIDVHRILAYGMIGSQPQLTDAEKKFLNGKVVFEMDTLKISTSDIDALLGVYFGITFADCADKSPERLVYFDQTDCIYVNAVASQKPVMGIVDYSILEDGIYCVRYASGFSSLTTEYFEVTLQRVNDYFKIVSNLPCDTPA